MLYILTNIFYYNPWKYWFLLKLFIIIPLLIFLTVYEHVFTLIKKLQEEYIYRYYAHKLFYSSDFSILITAFDALLCCCFIKWKLFISIWLIFYYSFLFYTFTLSYWALAKYPVAFFWILRTMFVIASKAWQSSLLVYC